MPLIVEFSVNATREHSFDMWTNRPALWWPRGIEHAWGEVTEWDPPHRVAYRWHLFFDPTEATDVAVTFSPGESGTDVRIEQRGWERLGDSARLRRTNTNRAWSAIAPVFVTACEGA